MGNKVLIVEDDPTVRGLYRLSLALAGFDVREAQDGLDALTIIEQHPPDLVVLDLFLPRLSGIAVQQEIAAHAHTKHIPIVVVTGSDLALPDMPCVLRKPVSPDLLVDTVRRCLASGVGGVSL